MRVSIKSDGMPYGVKVVDERTGEEIREVTAITWRAAVNDFCRAQIDLCITPIEVNGAVAEVVYKGKQIRRIEYADGTADDFPGEAK